MLFDENFNFLEKLIYSISCLSLTLSKLLPFLPKMAQCVGFCWRTTEADWREWQRSSHPPQPTTLHCILHPAWTLNVLVRTVHILLIYFDFFYTYPALQGLKTLPS